MFNLKGGVGKTTATHLLSWALARSGVKVLVFDLDAQMSISWTMMCREAYSRNQSWTEFMKDKETIYTAINNISSDNLVAHTVNIMECGSGKIDLCLGDSRLVRHESNLIQRIYSRLLSDDDRVVIALPIIIEKTAERLGSQVVLLDLNPSYSATNRLALATSQFLIIPCFFDAFSANGIDQMKDYLIPDIFSKAYNNESLTNQRALFKKINDHKNNKNMPKGVLDNWRFPQPNLKVMGVCFNKFPYRGTKISSAYERKRSIILEAMRGFLTDLPDDCVVQSRQNLSDEKLLENWTIYEIGDTGTNGINASELSIPAPFLTRSVARLFSFHMTFTSTRFEWRVKSMEAAKIICYHMGIPYSPQAAKVLINAPDLQDDVKDLFNRYVSAEPSLTNQQAYGSVDNFADLPAEEEAIEHAWQKRQRRLEQNKE